MSTQDVPQLDGSIWLTDGGMETTLLFLDGFDLPEFAAFPLVDDDAGRAALQRYFREYVRIAERDGRGIVLETPTWRASADWGAKLGYDAAALDRVNRDAVQLVRDIASTAPVVVSGLIGPRGDGYVVSDAMSPDEAERFHSTQVASLAAAGADMVSIITVNYVEEGLGVARAAAAAGLPVVVGFTVETDGNLPTGQTLADAIEQVDREAPGAVSYYMINCAHPTHFAHVLAGPGPWDRVRAIRSNASKMSHEELDNAEELDRGDVADLAAEISALRAVLPNLAVIGGCCGTDHHHIDAMSREVGPVATASA